LCVNTLLLDPAIENPDAPMMLTIEDLSKDPKFEKKPFVKDWPYLRFYCGVPLRTHNKINIGSLCVVDDIARPGGLTETQKANMWALADTIMNYLELVRGRNDMIRARKMSQGLGKFIAAGIMPRQPKRSKFKRSRVHKTKVGVATEPESLHKEVVQNMAFREKAAEATVPEATDTPEPSAKETRRKEAAAIKEAVQKERNISTPQEVFTRAAEVLIEACEVDGFVFVDADFADQGESPPPFFSDSSTTIAALPGVQKDYVLGQQGARIEISGLTRRFLDMVIDRYPTGHIFYYGDSSESDSDPEELTVLDSTSDSSAGSPMISVKNILKGFLPQSKSAIVMPIFTASAVPFAIGFGWTCKRERIFVNESETAYLNAFNASIMAEIARISILNADKAKGDFISSVSHELRSPLHGILASTEFLQEGELSELQSSFVQIIESCGRTLLSTINHILEHSKLITAEKESNKPRESKKADEDGNAVLRSQMPVAAVNLAAIIEEVSAVVFASTEYKPVAVNKILGGSAVPSRSIISIIEIQKRDDWTFITQAEAFRRILLNLTGNSLKYTEKGWVKISLTAEDLGGDVEPVGESAVTLTVSDSGKGISKDFLKNKLFTPFSQEDPMLSGTGLGLSIVKQLVSSIGGDIKVRSSIGEGTTISVTMTLVRARFVPSPTDERQQFQLQRKHSIPFDGTVSPEARGTSMKQLEEVCLRLKGRRVHMVGFGFDHEALPAEREGMISLSLAVKTYLTDWVGLSIADEALVDVGDWSEDLVVANHCPPLLESFSIGKPGANPGKRGGPALIVLCSDPSHFSIYSSKKWQDNLGVLEVCIKP
jgi:signal transduction histidine kinase